MESYPFVWFPVWLLAALQTRTAAQHAAVGIGQRLLAYLTLLDPLLIVVHLRLQILLLKLRLRF